MIYTIGRPDIYEKYLNNDPDAAKGIGGSVWKNYYKAKETADKYNYNIYLVVADWEMDTLEQLGDHRHLNKTAKLLRIG